MLSDNENTNRGTVERSPFLDAYLEFDQQVFKAIRLRDELLRARDLGVLVRYRDAQRVEPFSCFGLERWAHGARAARERERQYVRR